MKPAPFIFFAPESLEEAVCLLAEHGDEAKVLAGGQSLVPMMAFRLATPTVLIDLNRVNELEYLRMEDGTLAIGALTRQRALEKVPWLAKRCPMIVEAVQMIGHVAIRNRGTVGGSIAHADSSAEWPALLLALDGEVEAVGPKGTQVVPAPDLFVTHFTTSLAPDQIIKEVRVKLPSGRVGSAFVELAHRHGDFALSGVGVLLHLSDDGTVAYGRVTLIGAKDTAVRSFSAEEVLGRQQPTDEVLDEAAAAVDDEIEPVSDVHASEEFRRHLARVLTRRALAKARDRTQGGVLS